jgi:RNA polymerase sigma-70 factor, ECF subfamily
MVQRTASLDEREPLRGHATLSGAMSETTSPYAPPSVPESALVRRELGNDEEVVRRILGGERPLFEVIMRRYNQRLYRTARAILRDDAEAEDVMQDAYVRAYAHLRDFHGEGASFGGWLTRIAVNEALARLRRRNRHDSLDQQQTDEDTMTAHEASPELQASDGELRTVLEHAIDTLPESFRTVFVLRHVEELTTLETAECLAIPEDTVKTRLHRARGLLQRSLLARIDEASRAAYPFERPRCDQLVSRVWQRLDCITET